MEAMNRHFAVVGPELAEKINHLFASPNVSFHQCEAVR